MYIHVSLDDLVMVLTTLVLAPAIYFGIWYGADWVYRLFKR